VELLRAGRGFREGVAGLLGHDGDRLAGDALDLADEPDDRPGGALALPRRLKAPRVGL
jgi:hypothetical protein